MQNRVFRNVRCAGLCLRNYYSQWSIVNINIYAYSYIMIARCSFFVTGQCLRFFQWILLLIFFLNTLFAQFKTMSRTIVLLKNLQSNPYILKLIFFFFDKFENQQLSREEHSIRTKTANKLKGDKIIVFF